MSESRSSLDSASAVLIAIAIATSIIELVFRPFLFGPIAFIAMMIGTAMSGRYRRFSRVSLAVVVLCFMIGATYAVWNSRALY